MELCRIILVDDHSLFRSGMRGLLDRYDGIRVVGEASTGEEFLAMLPATEADVVFMDFAMPGMNGAETTEKALALEPGLKVITLSMFGDENYYSRMVQAGAKGFLMKDSPMDEVLRAIETVAAGGTYFCEEVLRSLASRMQTAVSGIRRAPFDPGDRDSGLRVPRAVEPGDRRRTVHFEAHGGQAPGQYSGEDRM